MKNITAYTVIFHLFLIFLTGIPLYAGDAGFSIAYSELPPYFYQDENGDSVGFFTELIAESLQMTGINNYHFKILPFARMVNYMKNGEVQCLASISNELRREIAWFPKEPLWMTHWGFFIRKEDMGKFKFESFEDLRNRRIGLIRGYGIPGGLKAYVDQHAIVDYVTTEEQNFRKLMKNRVDFVMSEHQTGKKILIKLGGEEKIIFLKNKLIASANLYAVFSKEGLKKKGLGSEFTDRFSENLVEVKKSDKFKMILAKYNIDELHFENITWPCIN